MNNSYRQIIVIFDNSVWLINNTLVYALIDWCVYISDRFHMAMTYPPSVFHTFPEILFFYNNCRSIYFKKHIRIGWLNDPDLCIKVINLQKIIKYIPGECANSCWWWLIVEIVIVLSSIMRCIFFKNTRLLSIEES